MMRTLLGALTLLLLAVLVTAADKKGASIKLQYRKLKRQYETQFEVFQRAYNAASTPQERRKVFAEKHPDLDRYGARFLALARKAPRDETSVDALLWVIMHPAGLPTGTDARSQALDLLRKDHIKSGKLATLCTLLPEAPDPASEQFLRAALAKSPHNAVKARACMSLALNLKYRGRILRRLKAEPKLARQLVPVWGRMSVAALRKGDADKMLAESEKMFQRVARKYGKVMHPQHGNLKEMARVHLDAMRDPVGVGKPAPEIEGEDLDGKQQSLSAQRGKVVLLDFWGHMFPPCHKGYAVERDLVKSLADRPFVLLGVNADGLKENAKKIRRTKKLTWPSWWDGGGAGGPIATRWDVHQWPMLFLIDHKGLVRHVYLGWPDRKVLDEALRPLLKKARAARKKG
jgi:peroxiredoxin